jgi:hypothetical protein
LKALGLNIFRAAAVMAANYLDHPPNPDPNGVFPLVVKFSANDFGRALRFLSNHWQEPVVLGHMHNN